MRLYLTLIWVAVATVLASCHSGTTTDPLPALYGKISLGADTVYLNAGGTDAQAGYFSVRNQLNTTTDGWLVSFTARSRPAGTGSAALHGPVATGLTLVHSTPAGTDLNAYFGLPTESVSLSSVNGRLRISFNNLTETDATGAPLGTRRLSGYVTEP